MAHEVALDFVASRIRGELAAQRRTHAELAEALGLTPPAMSRRLQGRVEFSASELIRAAAFLDLSVDELLGKFLRAGAA